MGRIGIFFIDVRILDDVEMSERVKIFEVFGLEEVYGYFVLELEIFFIRRLFVYDDSI